MRFSLLVLCSLCSLAQASWHEPFKAGDKVFDSRIYQTGTVVKILTDGSLDVKLDNKTQIKTYNNYYASDLGPKVELCNEQSQELSRDFFCAGDKFIYTLQVFGKNRKAKILEVFQGSDGYTENNKYGKIVYAVQIEGESKVRFLNSGHLGWMEPTK